MLAPIGHKWIGHKTVNRVFQQTDSFTFRLRGIYQPVQRNVMAIRARGLPLVNPQWFYYVGEHAKRRSWASARQPIQHALITGSMLHSAPLQPPANRGQPLIH